MLREMSSGSAELRRAEQLLDLHFTQILTETRPDAICDNVGSTRTRTRALHWRMRSTSDGGTSVWPRAPPGHFVVSSIASTTRGAAVPDRLALEDIAPQRLF